MEKSKRKMGEEDARSQGESSVRKKVKSVAEETTEGKAPEPLKELDGSMYQQGMEVDDIKTKATTALRKGLKNDDAELTEAQLEVVLGILGGQSVLYIDKTGAGKSETYFVATKLLREANPRAGPVIVVTPLVALIHDQVRRAKAFRLNAYGYFSTKKGMSEFEQSNVVTLMTKNKVDVLFLTAEMLSEISVDERISTNGNRYTPKLLKGGLALKLNTPMEASLPWSHVPLLVIDEIHYISEAGHAFRQDYARVWNALSNHPWFRRALKLGLTATVNKRVRESINNSLPINDWTTVLGSLYRENIALRIQPKPPNAAARLDYVRQLHLSDPSANILVFCKATKDVTEFSRDLKNTGVSSALIGFYYSPSGLSNQEEIDLLLKNEENFRLGKSRILFSTCALGLGYDKSDIHHVVHMWTPNSIVQYYQEFGRAGRSRAGDPAVAHMLPTSPWNPTGWVAVLSDICWFLAHRKGFATRELILDRGVALNQKESDITRAIVTGTEKKMLRMDDKGTVQLLDIQENLQAVDKMFADSMKEEVQVMDLLSHNCGHQQHCLWRFILDKFEGHHNDLITCDKCSGLKCKPGGDIAPNAQAGGNVFYRIIAPRSGVHIFALHKVGEDLLVDEERIKEIFSMHRPSMVIEPPGKWTICPIPDSQGENVKNARSLSQWLNGMEVSTFIQRNPNEHRKVTGTTSKAMRQNILKTKFRFDWDNMPTIGNVLLFDDRVSSGDTIDTVVLAMREKLGGTPMEFAAITQFVYTGSKISSPEVSRLTAMNRDATLEQPAQI